MATYGTTDRLTGGTVTAMNSIYNPIAYIVDNDLGTYWGGDTQSGSWIKYDCGVGITWAFGKLRCKPVYGYGPNAFTVNLSNNDSDYTQVYSGNMANTSGSPWQEFTWINTTKYRYIKIITTSHYHATVIEIYEIEAMEMLPATTGFFHWFFSEAWRKHDRLWIPKLVLPKEGYSY